MSAQELREMTALGKEAKPSEATHEPPGSLKNGGRTCAAAAEEQCRKQHDLPIDKGWAWVVATTACLLFALCGGALRAHGLIYVEVLQEFKSPPTETYWIFGLASAVAHGFAPVPGYFIQRFNHRLVLIVGTLLMSLGICMSAYMPRSQYMFFTFSIVYGIGLCCTLLTAFVCVGPYFKRLRTLATGIASAGSGIGTVVMSFALRFLFDELPFSGAMLLYGGIILHIVVLASLQRPITYYMRRRRSSVCSTVTPVKVSSAAKEAIIGSLSNGDTCEAPLIARRSDARNQAHADGDEKLFHSMSIIGAASAKVEKSRRRRTISEPAPYKDGIADQYEGKWLFTATDIIHASVHSLPPLAEEEHDGRPAKVKAVGVSRAVYVRILKSPVFWCIGMSIFCYAQGFSLSYSVVPPYAGSVGISKGVVAWLIAAGGFGEAVGRLANGYLSDLKKMSPTVHYCLLPLLPATTALLCPIIRGPEGIGLFLVMAGLLGSSMFPFQTAVLREQLGDECVTPGLSMLFLFQTVGYVAAALMTGILYDLTGSWGDIFYYVSAVMFCSSLCAAMLSARKLYAKCKARGAKGFVKDEEAADKVAVVEKKEEHHMSRMGRAKQTWNNFWHMHPHGHPHVPNCIHFKWHPRTHHNSIHN